MKEEIFYLINGLIISSSGLISLDCILTLLKMSPTIIPIPKKKKISIILEKGKEYSIEKIINENSFIRPFTYKLMIDKTKKGKAIGYELGNYSYLYFLRNYGNNFTDRRAFLKFVKVLENDMYNRGVKKVSIDSYLDFVDTAKKQGFKSNSLILEGLYEILPLPKRSYPTLGMSKSIENKIL